MNLTINYADTSWNGQSTFNTVYDSACDFYTWNGITYTTSVTSIGIGSHVLEYNTLTNPGCDSTAYQNLYLGSTSSDTTTVFTCEDYYWINIYGDTLFEMLTQGTQTYTVTYTNEMGCDSTHTLNLTINNCNLGCTDSIAINYNPIAVIDDSSCIYCDLSVSILTMSPSTNSSCDGLAFISNSFTSSDFK